MRRREFIALVSSTAVWPLVGFAQQRTLPVIGFLSTRWAAESAELVIAFERGLEETGQVKGRDVTIVYKWADNQYDRLRPLVDDLVRQQLAVIVAITTPAALVAKAATSTIPVVFEIAGDPIELGLAASLSRPGGNLTGVTQLGVEVQAKHLELLHEVLPTANVIGALLNPANALAKSTTNQLEMAARALGLELHVLHASADREFDAVFETAVKLHVQGLVIGVDPLFASRRAELAALALRHGLPTIGSFREFVDAGGLMSYSGNLNDAYRLAGIFAGKVLKGARPADLPIQQSAAVELLVNLKTAKRLGVTVPPALLARADDVIE